MKRGGKAKTERNAAIVARVQAGEKSLAVAVDVGLSPQRVSQIWIAHKAREQSKAI